MPYHTITTFRDAVGEDRFLGLVDADGDGVVGDGDVARFERAARQSASKLDSYIGNVYPVPLSGEYVTDALLEADLNVLAYLLSPDGDFMTETVKEKHDAALKWAKDIGCKKAQLGVTASEPPPRVSRVRSSGPAPSMTRTKLADLL